MWHCIFEVLMVLVNFRNHQLWLV